MGPLANAGGIRECKEGLKVLREDGHRREEDQMALEDIALRPTQKQGRSLAWPCKS